MEQEVQGSIPGLAATISEIGCLLLPSRDMADIPLKRRKILNTTKQPITFELLDIETSYLDMHAPEMKLFQMAPRSMKLGPLL